MAKKKESEKFQLPDPTRTRELYAAVRPSYEEALRRLSESVRDLLEQQGLSPTIKYRIKRFDAYYEKLQRSARKTKGAPVISDLLGLRVICPFLEDLGTIEALISRHFEVVEVVRKATVHSFREFGYDSVHLLVRLQNFELEVPLPHTRRLCEVQLRTTLQDAWAEVEHELIYKSRLTFPNESIRRKLAALNATLTLSDNIFQEIRDYQKGIMALDRRRRGALESALQLPGIELPLVAEEPAPAPAESPPLPITHGSPLERAMLEALQVHSQHQFEQAALLYSRLLGMRLNRKIRALIYNHRGMARFALGHTAEALSDFSQALSHDADNLRARCNRALVYRLQKRLAPALADYDAVLESDPSLADAWLGRAQTYLEMAFADRALTDCEKALEINSELTAARELQARIRRDFFRL
ncbi:MAG: hypothetical protein IH614_15195 [Desulfuromonadales bacterium]|nr:hypothetical protein [Desulfuromonadales bacterium]